MLYVRSSGYETLALYTGLPLLYDGYPPRVMHLLGAGTAGLLVFTLGFRLLPRFLVASPPRMLVVLVLPAGALGPILLITHFGGDFWFQLGAVIEAIAVIGFALGVGLLFIQSERRRVGFYGILAGAISGVVVVVIGLWFVFGHQSSSLVLAHLRLNLLGFLGLTIIRIAYQFYPPAVRTVRGASNRTALISIAGLVSGLFVRIVGLGDNIPLLTTLGQLLTLGGTFLYTFLIVAVFTRSTSRSRGTR